MFPAYEIMLQGFIPKSLGKPLRDYFRHDPNFNPARMVNFQEFEQFLKRADQMPGTWLREPFPVSLLNSFYLTNDGEIGHHSQYKVRLAGVLDLTKAGRYTATERPLQPVRSSDTHRCTVSLAPVVPTNFTSVQPRQILARFAGPESKTPKVTGHYSPNVNFLRRAGSLSASPPAYGRRNVTEGFVTRNTGNRQASFIGPQAPSVLEPCYAYNASTIKVWASGGYPFILGSPGITLGLNVTVVWLGNEVEITIKGQHDRFPAYELYANGRLVYSYDPVANGQRHGPQPTNLLSEKVNSLPIASSFGQIPFSYTERVPVPRRHLT